MVSTIRTKERMIQQKYYVICGVNNRPDMQQFTQPVENAKIDIMSIFRPCKNNNMSKNHSLNSANNGLVNNQSRVCQANQKFSSAFIQQRSFEPKFYDSVQLYLSEKLKIRGVCLSS